MFVKKEQLPPALLGFFVVALLFLSGCLESEKGCYVGKCVLSDSEYIGIAKETPEAKAFLQKYPDANFFIERGDDLSASFVVGDYVFIDLNKGIYEERQGNNYLRLRTFINPSTNKPQSSFIECRPSIENYLRIDQDLINYIKTENCLDD